MGRNILVAVDDSAYSRTAFDWALEQFPAEDITILHVINSADIYRATGVEDGMIADFEGLRESQEKRAQELLDSLQSEAEDAGSSVAVDHVIGEVAKTIVNYADNNDFEHIILGSRGRTGASRILLGSVAETVARRAGMPVTIVR